MAHDPALRNKVRAAYIFEQLGLEVAALKHGVPLATARNWKRAAKEQGDDWDKARGAQMLAGGGIEDVVRQTLAIIIQQTQSTVEAIQTSDMQPGEKVKALSSLADSYNKLISVSRRMMPETDKLAVAMETLKLLNSFIQSSYPQHLQAFVDILRPFGEELAGNYGH